MAKTITVSKVGGGTKSIVDIDGKRLIKYGGSIVDQSNNEITIDFRNGDLDVFSFSDFTEVFETTNAEELADFLTSNGFFLDALARAIGEGFFDFTFTGDDRGTHMPDQLSVEGELIAGKDSYKVPAAYHCQEANTISNTITAAINRTELFQSDSNSSTGMFGSTSAGSFVLVGSPLPYEGAKVKYAALADVDPSLIVSEFYDEATDQWYPVSFMSTNANSPFSSHAWNIATHEHTSEQIFFGFDPFIRDQESFWKPSTMNINGEDIVMYWARFRVVSDIAGDPLVEQIKLHTDRIEIESTGVQYYGMARKKKIIFSGVSNVTPNALKFPSDQPVGYTQEFSANYGGNELRNNQDDGFGIVVNKDFGLDTSVPLVLSVSYYVPTTGAGDVVFKVGSTQVVDGYKYDGNNIPMESEEVAIIEADTQYVRRTTKFKIPIYALVGDSGVVIDFSRQSSSDNRDNYDNSVIVSHVTVSGYFWK